MHMPSKDDNTNYIKTSHCFMTYRLKYLRCVKILMFQIFIYIVTIECAVPKIEDMPILQGVQLYDAVYYSCSKGFVLIGDDIRICLKSGDWSGSEPECLSK